LELIFYFLKKRRKKKIPHPEGGVGEASRKRFFK
jgi:hypothetical protein